MMKDVDTCNSLDFMHLVALLAHYIGQKKDVCWLPFQHVLCKIYVP